MFKKYRTHLFNFISLTVGIVGIYLGIQSNKAKEPIFRVEPIRTQILTGDRIKSAPIKVYKNNGQQITKDLTSVRFYFWNEGKEAIKLDNVLKPLMLNVKGAVIVDFKILKSSRQDITNINLSQVDSNNLKLTFNILENRDGVSGEIMIEGNPNAEIKLNGALEGVKSIDDVTHYSLWVDRFVYLFPQTLKISFRFF